MSGDKKAEFYARRMHTPDDPARAEMRASLREISKLLIPLHRSLIDSAKLEYTENTGPIEGPGHLLRLVSEDPFFAWLRPMTSLIVDIDEMARVDFEPAEALAIGKRASTLLGGETAEFNERYVPVLQRDTDVAIGHAALRKALAKLAAQGGE